MAVFDVRLVRLSEAFFFLDHTLHALVYCDKLFDVFIVDYFVFAGFANCDMRSSLLFIGGRSHRHLVRFYSF